MRFRRIPILLLFSVVALVLFAAARVAASALARLDFQAFWVAARLFPQNPYSFELTAKYLGVSEAMPIKNPPWAILFVLPFALFRYQDAFALWAVMTVVVVTGCARAAWNLSNASPSLAPALLSLLFGPTIVLLMLGQVTVLVLLGIMLFLVMAEQRRDWLAGASLLLVSFKPHVALLFLIVVTLWTVQFKRWAIFLSCGLTLAASCIVSLAINPRIFSQFLERTRVVMDEKESYQNLGGMLYSASGHHIVALLPQLIGVIWLLFFWWRHKSDWEWKSHGMTVLVASCVCSYYSRPYDEVLAVPALVTAFSVGCRRIFLTGFLVTNLGYALYLSNVAGHFGYGYMFLWWTASGWLLTCVLSQGLRRPATDRIPIAPELE
jgi:hypothetical protein